MHALKTLVAAVAASLTLGACAGSTSIGAMQLADGPHAGRSVVAAAEPTTVKVSNYNWMDVVVYAVQGTSRTRLGTVTTMGNATFRVPQRMVASATSVRLMVDPIGSIQGWQTEELTLRAGQEVQFNVQNALGLSSVLLSR